MPGRNLFETYQRFTIGTKMGAASISDACVFISHKKEDKDKAREVAEFLLRLSVDIYFDENDKILAAARDLNDAEQMVKCIEDGLNRCTHLLGVITQNTKGSWWVPYEIGGATGRHRECAHLITGEVTELPLYVSVAKILPDVESLENWVPSSGTTSANAQLRLLEKLAATLSPPKCIPRSRSLGTISFV